MPVLKYDVQSKCGVEPPNAIGPSIAHTLGDKRKLSDNTRNKLSGAAFGLTVHASGPKRPLLNINAGV